MPKALTFLTTNLYASRILAEKRLIYVGPEGAPDKLPPQAAKNEVLERSTSEQFNQLSTKYWALMDDADLLQKLVEMRAAKIAKMKDSGEKQFQLDQLNLKRTEISRDAANCSYSKAVDDFMAKHGYEKFTYTKASSNGSGVESEDRYRAKGSTDPEGSKGVPDFLKGDFVKEYKAGVDLLAIKNKHNLALFKPERDLLNQKNNAQGAPADPFAKYEKPTPLKPGEDPFGGARK